MNTIQTTTQVDADGILHVDLPLGAGHAGAECVVTVQVTGTKSPSVALTREQRWERIFAATAGKWQGDPLVRPDQGELEERELFD
jgi:hypothetical protein